MAKIQSSLSLSYIPEKILNFENTNIMIEKDYTERQKTEEKEKKALITKSSELKARLLDEKRQHKVRLAQLKFQLKETARAMQECKEKEVTLNYQVDEKNKRLTEMKILTVDDDLVSYKMKLNNILKTNLLKKSELKKDFKKLSFAVKLYKRELCCNVTCAGNDTVIFTTKICGMNKSPNEYITLRTKEDALYFECVEVSSQIINPKLIHEYKKRNDILGLVMLFMKTFNGEKKLNNL